VTSQGVKQCGGIIIIFLLFILILILFNFIPIKIGIPNKCNNLNSAGKNIFFRQNSSIIFFKENSHKKKKQDVKVVELTQ
jgi:hypothetical protein